MKVLILGGDGYLGWPTAMHLSTAGHEVSVVDNYLRRNLCMSTGTEPLFAGPLLPQRCSLWEEKSGHTIKHYIGDLCDYDFFSSIFNDVTPDAIIHYAEQPSAPFSMLDRRSASLTLHNNITVTHNLLYIIHTYKPDTHIIKLGTMGEYGTPNIDIEEGWIEISHNGRSDSFLFPRQAGSLYHTTKIMDTDLIWFYSRVWGIRASDLMQGPVYGFYTDENKDDSSLFPIFNYDEIFGTVLNRFMVQAVSGYPLTIYGKGNQKRGYLDIRDTLQCVRLCLENPPKQGELRIFNQFVETFSVIELAEQVSRVANAMGFSTQMQHLPNPRVEAEEHYYNPKHTGLIELGLQPHYLTDEYLAKMMEYISQQKSHINPAIIFQGVSWTK